MKRLGLARADWVALGLLVPVAVLATLITAVYLPPKKGDARRQPSSFFNAPYGTKAAYLTLRRLGYSVRRERRALEARTLDDTDVLFLLRPVVPLREKERTVLLEWVAKGHTLVISPSVNDDLGAWFRYGSRPSNEPPASTPRRGTKGHGLSVDPLTDGVEVLETRSRERFYGLDPVRDALGTPRVVWQDSHGAIALSVARGDGQVVALAATDFLENAALDRADHPELLVNLASSGASSKAPRTVAFDEAHLGFEKRDVSPVAIAKLVALSPYRPGLIQLLGVGLLSLVAGAVRFGAPRPEGRIVRRKQGELVRSAARLLAESRARDYVRDKLVLHYRRRLCRLTHLQPSSDDTELASAIARRTGRPAGDILETVASPGHDLLTTAQRLHHLMESIRHGHR